MALVLALLLLAGWGQVHRVLHPGVVAVQASMADAQAHKALPGGHEEGGSLCQLLDHLSHGDAPVPAVAALAAMPLPPASPVWTPLRRHASVPAPFEARGPPRFA